ncbi:hypothetical protein SRABI26_02702 [Arthrobacter sp. Bi26]|uniref:hypothetical protein n=1 Tax=Arthrobacter sp. Bi26 TaxID=2822350 RepID=UPI001DEFD167|nr:hypothetical protein [Arthrobacter sp. Bi26]CAH0233234.1 hypothetical protein SRABI26_02702 [Arthrobacter sp. Bi26]
MNYFLLALAIAAALVALLFTANILRVALGRATFDSGFAAFSHVIMAPAAGVTALWLFQTAVAR